MAPAPGGGLYLAVPTPAGSVVITLLDSTAQPRAGWPIVLDGPTACGLVLPVDDGSVRVLCSPDDLNRELNSGMRAFAFDSTGRLLPGWPVDLDGSYSGRVIGNELRLFGVGYFSDVVEKGKPSHEGWLVTVAADGAVRSGARTPLFETCCVEKWTVGPDGIAYGLLSDGKWPDESTGPSRITAIDLSGVRSGWPVKINGSASLPAFDAAGRIHVIVGSPWARPARTLVFDPAGRAVDAGSGSLDIEAASECVGIGGSCPSPTAPLVGPDGTTFVVGRSGERTTVAGLNSAGEAMAGWPYRSKAMIQSNSFCPPRGACDGYTLAAPAIGPGNIVYLLHAAADSSAGGSIVAVGRDGGVVHGWPVSLRRPDAGFWSVVVGSDGTVYALAVEPETKETASATVLAIAPDGTVLYRMTILEP